MDFSDTEIISLLMFLFSPISLILYFLYSMFFWLKILQIKEYRLDRIKDYIISGDFFRWLLSKINILLIAFSFLLFFPKISYFNVSPYVSFLIIIIYILINFHILTNIKKVLPNFTNRMKLVFIVNLILLFLLYNNIFIDPYINNSSGYITKTFHIIVSFLNGPDIINNFLFGSIKNSYPFIIFLSVLIWLVIILLSFPILTLISSWIVYPLARHLRQKKIDFAKDKISNFPNLKKLWITWSYAKSSVKEFVNHLISSKYETLCTPENKNSEMWVAMTINSSLSEKYEYFIAEMWAYRKSEIALLTDMVDQKDAFLTWLNTQHIWLFWNQENITKAKMEISESVKKNNWILYVNFDNELIRDIDFSHLNIVSYWLNSDSDWFISNIKYDWEYTDFTFSYKKNTYNFQTNLIWNTNFINLAWALCYAFDQNIDTNTIQKSLMNMPLPDSTMNILHRENGNIIINDTYNINETWVEKAIDFMDNFPDKSKILVVDDIVDLWKYADEIHFKLGETIAHKNLWEVIIVWELFKKQIKNWLLSKWFPEEKIKYNLYMNDIQNSVILLEWRRAKKYL